jgi:hypothetical protein
MQTDNMKLLLESAEAHAGDRLADAAFKAIEVGIVVPSRLEKELKAAGYFLLKDEAEQLKRYGYKKLENLYRVLVLDGEKVVAMGASADQPDALLHAILGYLRELDIAHFGSVLTLAVHQLADPHNIKGLNDKEGKPLSAERQNKIKAHLVTKLKRRAERKKKTAAA